MRIAKQLPRDPDAYKRLHAIADAYLAAFGQAFVAAVDGLRDKLTQEAIIRALESGRLAVLVEQIDWATAFDDPLLAEWQPLVQALLAEAGAEAVQMFEFPFRFDLDNPYSQQYIREHTAALVREVGQETKDAIRGVLEEAFRFGGHPREQARRIRNLVGLTRRQTGAVQRYHLNLLSQGTAEERAARLAERYAQKLLRYRAETIARYETMAAANGGAIQSFMAARDQGYIDPAITKRKWLFVRLPGYCRYCEAMDGVEVPFDEPFHTGLGDVMGPPIHPRDRCSVGLVVEVPS